MKLYVTSHNGVLDAYKEQIHNVHPLDAEKLVLWQDCAGSCQELAITCKKAFPKPIYVMQHGRRASRDYGAPLHRKFISDTFLAWGEWDKKNMESLGHKSEIVGFPLRDLIKPKIYHEEKIVLFIPVNTGKEEPDNLRVYNELLSYKLDLINQRLDSDYESLRGSWPTTTTRNALADRFTIVSKVLPWHKHDLYSDGIIKGFQDARKNNERIFNLLRNVDLVVGVDEGTTELFATAMDVPVIIVDGFEYRWNDNGGCRVKPPVSPGFTHVGIKDLKQAVEYHLAHPEAGREGRLATAEYEMSLSSIQDPIKRLHEIIGSKQ